MYVSYLELFCKGDLPLLPHSFIYSVTYLYQYRLVGIYFMIWVMIQYYFILKLKLFQLYQWEFFQVLLCPFDITLPM